VVVDSVAAAAAIVANGHAFEVLIEIDSDGHRAGVPPEAGVLLEMRAPDNAKEMVRCAERLREKMAHAGERWVYLKGGHLPGAAAIDLLHDGDRMIELTAPRVDTKNTHGTGCTLSAALAALIPQAPDVPTAARRAKDYLTKAIANADRLDVGKGHGPVHHFHAWWGK
jgi:hydroxymethylpyrimidine/phosphomethylpyrimidine kinase